MAHRSFILPPLKLTRRSACGTPIRENLHQGVRVVHPTLDQGLFGGVTSSEHSSAVAASLASSVSASVSVGLESGACGDNELTMHEIESKSSMAGWEAIRSSMLAVDTESQGMPAGQKCELCGENYALIKCWQCGHLSHIFVKVVWIVYTRRLLFYMLLSSGRYVTLKYCCEYLISDSY